MGKEATMINDRRRLLALAMESLENKRRDIEFEIAGLARELRAGRRSGNRTTAVVMRASARQPQLRRHFNFSREERLRRSQRMKAYWEKWRKQRGRS